jgi:hypothetical protein
VTEQAVSPLPTEDETARRGTGPGGADPTDATPAGAADPADAGSGDDSAEPAGGGWHPLLRVLVMLGVVAALVGALVLLALRYDVAGRLLTSDRTADARVGDCLASLPDVADSAQRRAAEARVVACSGPDAAYDVIGRVDGQTEEQVRDGRQCEPFVAEGGTYYTYSSIPPAGTGYLLCLVPRG